MTNTRHHGGARVMHAKSRAPEEISLEQSDDDVPGAIFVGAKTCRFKVWAPNSPAVKVHLIANDRLVPMRETGRGYHEASIDGISPGDLYRYELSSDTRRADPASRFQPEGVHGPSRVIAGNFHWDEKGWSGLPLKDYIIYELKDYIIYELHVGLFTPAGTFDAVISYIEYLVQLGVTAVELMPVAQFPGGSNWGYDGVFPFAVQNSYGGPQGLKRLVNACHQRGLAVILDVVYNHLGPEGNYFNDFGPYFTDRYKTPWGWALNFDGPFSDEVRSYFIQNALYWFKEFHIDSLRLDAVHAILDHSPATFLEELSAAVQRTAASLQRQIFLIAESADNNARLIRPREAGGYGLDAQWNDDFHHCLRTLLTEDRTGYYEDYGEFTQLIKAYRDGFVYSGEFSRFRRRRHGSSSRDIPAERFVVFAQNHDQVGNRMLGDRLSQSASFDDLKLAAGLVILSPYIPLLFMGEEYAETTAFPYFISHSDAELIEAVRRGRQTEFAAFGWQGEIPNPQDGRTFLRAKLNHELRNADHHMVLLKFYRELIALRKRITTLSAPDKNGMEVIGLDSDRVLVVHRWRKDERALFLANLNKGAATITLALPPGHWRKLIDSADETWRAGGSLLGRDLPADDQSFSLSARSFALFVRDQAELRISQS
ncbi:MAG: malto-oligosyltrehalose trehalohydrolase [Candidatus Binatia bacterium]